MRDRAVGSWIERRARIAPSRPALIYGASSITYGDLANRVRRLANGLRDLGVRRGDRVGWLGSNHPAFLETFFAAAKLGAVTAPVNHRLDPAVISAVLEADSPTLVVSNGRFDDVSFPSSVISRVVVNSSAGAGVPYEGLISRSPDDTVDEDIGLDELCLLPHTSGTTGIPKGVMLTHGNITWNVLNALSVTDFRSDDVTIAIAPFFRTGGTGMNVLPLLFKGGTVVIPEDQSPDEILELIEQRRVTAGFGNPDLLNALTKSTSWHAADLSNIRSFIVGGAPVHERLIDAYRERGVTFLQGYGLSEAAPLVLLLDPESASSKLGSAGKPVLYVDIRIVRPDGVDAGTNETGELLVSGPNVMAGYWNQPDATADAINEEGWLHTGDAARIDDDGYVWIVDRVRDAYVSSGHVVYPGNVERVLALHPAVADAGAAAVDGVATGFVVLAAGDLASEEELLDLCRSRLAPHEVPSTIAFVDRLPRNSVGKLVRAKLAMLEPAVVQLA